MRYDNFSRQIILGTLLSAALATGGVSAATVDDGSDASGPRDHYLQRFDHNGDGELGARERHRARRVYDRLDVNDSGKIGPRERQRARRIYDRVDVNDDGMIGPRERHRARRAYDRVDVNNDGRLGPRERRAAQGVKRAHR